MSDVICRPYWRENIKSIRSNLLFLFDEVHTPSLIECGPLTPHGFQPGAAVLHSGLLSLVTGPNSCAVFQGLTVTIRPCVKDASVPSPTASWWGSTTPHGTRSVCSAPCVNSLSPPAVTSEKGNFTANTTTNSKRNFPALPLLFFTLLWLQWFLKNQALAGLQASCVSPAVQKCGVKSQLVGILLEF